MKLIDYDKMFEEYMKRYVTAHADEFPDEDSVEDALPDLYNHWVDEHRKEFEKYTDAEELVRLIAEYDAQRIPLPDLVCDRITELPDGPAAMARALRSENYTETVQMTLINLLREVDSLLPLDWYLERIEEAGAEDEIADNAAEAVDALVDRAGERVRSAFLRSENDEARFRLVDTVINLGPDERVYDYLITNLHGGDKAIWAAYLAKYGDERALPDLQKELRNSKIDYIEYVELRNAIEALGGTPEIEMSFDGEKYYEALKQRRKEKGLEP
ncbi:MAG: hypothetical protein KIG36_06235 [Eubacteriales bacterium]|nr:hypothetical protein [Eubacteriales bacterium]